MPRIECPAADVEAEGVHELRAGQQHIGIDGGFDLAYGHCNFNLFASSRKRNTSSTA